ncbi:MAG: hypothetical protein SVV03_03615, partial [Candidatus Nanohaloarchaea archaeon]|nr:hypothetical protein [Candidatus Nanohaloarchaea archaeon]
MRTEYSIAVLVLAFMLLPTLGAAAEWDNPNAWVAPSNVSDGSNVVAVMQVLNDVGNPVVPGDCDTLNTRYRYPPNSADPGGMTYINGSNGFYFSDIQVGSESSSVTLEAEGSGCPDFNDGTSSLTFGNFSTAGNLSTSIMNATDRFLEGETYSIWLDVSNNGNFVSQVDNTWFLYNWTGNLIDSGSTSQVGDHYVADISMPLTGKENYFLAFKSDKPTSNISNPFGGDSKAITVEKELEASVDTIDVHNRCNGNASICQKGAVVQVRFRETRNHAETVSGRVQGNGKNFTQLNFTRTSPDLWKANFTIPVDFDTSNYGKELEIITSGSSDLSSVTESSTVTVRPFAIKRGIIQTYAFQGSSMEIVFGPEYPFTGIPLSRDQMKRVYLEIEYPDGNVENIWNNVKEVPDENYDTDLNKYRYLWDVPEDAPTGTYNFEVRLTDQFNEERSELFNFDVKSRSLEPTDVVVNKIPSYLTDIDSKTEMEKTFESRGTVSGEVLLTNNGSETATVDVSFSGDIKNLTSAKVVRSDGSLANPPFDIQEGQTRPVRLSFDLQKFRGYQGIVRFDVQGDTLQYDRSITVGYTVENPCDVTATDFCLLSGEIDKTYTRQGQFEPNVSVRNTGNSSVSLSVSAEGNITDIASLTKESLDLQPGD